MEEIHDSFRGKRGEETNREEEKIRKGHLKQPGSWGKEGKGQERKKTCFKITFAFVLQHSLLNICVYEALCSCM